MTNDETTTESGDFSVAIAFVSSLEFRDWALIRHSDFVIRISRGAVGNGCWERAKRP
jgi:hypothetical protein